MYKPSPITLCSFLCSLFFVSFKANLYYCVICVIVSMYCFAMVGIHTCFKCKKTGDDVVQCSMPSCGLYYHGECLSHVGRKDSGRIICSRHNCATCMTRLPMKSAAKASKGSIPFLC